MKQKQKQQQQQQQQQQQKQSLEQWNLKPLLFCLVGLRFELRVPCKASLNTVIGSLVVS